MAIPGYRIVRKIRQGGMSTVYLAIQNSMDREVALKVMSPSLSNDPSFGSRFYREAKIVGKLSHPNIVSVYDVGNHKHYNYIAMDFLPNSSLLDRMEEGVNEADTISTIRDMASALSYAHQKGFIHRDIKPDNILYRADKSAVLCDFGIAKALKSNIKMTSVGAVLGTPHYMSPEQAQGKNLDGRADLYSLGVVFFETLTGQVPFNGDDALAVAIKHMTTAVPKLPRQFKRYQPIIEKMMAKKTVDRYQTGDEIISDLDKLSESKNITPINTQTGSTTIQVVNQVSTLLAALWTTLNVSFKRLMLTKIHFKSTATQLSNRQVEELDNFIFNDDYSELPEELSDVPLIQDTIEQPVIKFEPQKSYLSFISIAIIVIAIGYFSLSKPKLQTKNALDISTQESLIEENIDLETPDKAIAIIDQSELDPPLELAKDNITPEIIKTEIDLPKLYPLTISTYPAQAKIRILNIKPRYKEGMTLKSGAYHIEVSANNYLSKTFWLTIKNKALNKHIKLTPTRQLLAEGSIITDKIRSGDDGPQMVVLPQNSLVFEETQRKLNITSPIAVSQKEITFAEYDKFAAQTERTLPDDFGWGRADRPVVGITFHEAQAYAKWLSEQTKQRYRLPTQDEWEYAYRGSKTTQYWWGENKADNRANCKKGCKSKYSKLFNSTTAPTASFEANPFGLYDMAGNAAEWINACQAWQDDAQTLCKSSLTAGGSHKDKIANIQANSTALLDTDSRSKTVGFRVILEL